MHIYTTDDLLFFHHSASLYSCKEARYCTKECQGKHWKVHKDICQQIAEIKGFIPPSSSSSSSASSALTNSNTVSTPGATNNLGIQEPSEEDLRIAWAIAAVAEVNRQITSAHSTVPSPSPSSSSSSSVPTIHHESEGNTSNGTVSTHSNIVSSGSIDNTATELPGDMSTENTAVVPSFVPSLNSVQNWNFSGMVPDVPPKQFTLYSLCNTPLSEITESDDNLNSPLANVARLLQEGAVVDPPEAFGIPLHGAASAGQVKIVQYLLEQGASVNRFTRTGQTALQLAVLGNYTDIIQLLLQYGANIFCSLTPPPQTLASNQDDSYSSSYLVNRYHRNVITNFDPQGNGGIHERTLLHFIAMQDTTPEGKSVDSLCSSWCQALSLLVNSTISTSNSSTASTTSTTSGISSVSPLVTKTASNRPVPFCGVDPLDEDNCSPLLYAAVHANMGALKVLLKYGANPGKRDTTVLVPSPSNAAAASAGIVNNTKSSTKPVPVTPATVSASIIPASPLVATLEPTFIASLATVAALLETSDPTEAYGELQEYIEIIKLLIDAGGELPNECTVDPEDIEWKFPAFSRLPPPPPSPSSSPAVAVTVPTVPKLFFTPFSALCSQIPLAPVVSALLQKTPQSCNPRIPNSDGSDCLTVAISCGNVQVVKELIKYGMIPATHTCTTPTWESSLVHTAYHRAVTLAVPTSMSKNESSIPSTNMEDLLVTETVLAELKQTLKI